MSVQIAVQIVHTPQVASISARLPHCKGGWYASQEKLRRWNVGFASFSCLAEPPPPNHYANGPSALRNWFNADRPQKSPGTTSPPCRVTNAFKTRISMSA